MKDASRLKDVWVLLAALPGLCLFQCSSQDRAEARVATSTAGSNDAAAGDDAFGGAGSAAGLGLGLGGGAGAATSGASAVGGISSGGSDLGNAGGAGDANSAGGGSAGSLAGAGGATMTCGTGKGVVASTTAPLLAANFGSGSLTPYRVCTTVSPNSGSPNTLNGEACAKFSWTQTGYNGTRDRRGAEACSDLAFYKEGWYGFRVYLPAPGFPLDKTQGIAQIFSLGGCSSWAAMLQVRNNELWFEHRGNCASPAEYQVRLATDIERNAWLPVVIHFVASHAGAGSVEVWYGQAVCSPESPTYRKVGINLGFGDWTGDTLSKTTSNEIGLKFGMYNFDDANYTPGETRTVYYDNVSQLVGNPANAFEAVNPTR